MVGWSFMPQVAHRGTGGPGALERVVTDAGNLAPTHLWLALALTAVVSCRCNHSLNWTTLVSTPSRISVQCSSQEA